MVEERREQESILVGKKVYVPRMTWGGAMAFAAAMRAIGIDADISPESDKRAMELGARFTSGDECYPAQVTMGELMKVTELPGFVPEKTVFFMPTSTGPCRFGQYAPYLRRLLRELGYEGVIVFDPSAENGYDAVGEQAGELMRTGWWALVASDFLRKMLLKTRPYEIHKGDTNEVYHEAIFDISRVLEQSGVKLKVKFNQLIESLTRCRNRFRQIPAKYDPPRPLIGVVGEIFCRLNRFSNEELVRRIEEHGGEVWLSDVAEWIWYTNWEQQKNLRLKGKRFSMDMLVARIKSFVQKHYEHKLIKPFHDDFVGYEEAEAKELMSYSEPYLPPMGCLGEMVLSIGRTVYLYHKGADGVIDISPFTCMNGITCEAVYPKLSRDYDGIPIRNFYFDGTQYDIDRDLGIFMELAHTYKKRKKKKRTYPFTFKLNGGTTLH
jgi:predicted nucleotide-binding protein (sugar kinase/HSP70/actin superfamily)